MHQPPSARCRMPAPPAGLSVMVAASYSLTLKKPVVHSLLTGRFACVSQQLLAGRSMTTLAGCGLQLAFDCSHFLHALDLFFFFLVVCTFVSCVCVVFFPPSVFPYSLLDNSVILGPWCLIVKSSAVFQRICLRLACILAESGLLNSLLTFLYSALHFWNLAFASCL